MQRKRKGKTQKRGEGGMAHLTMLAQLISSITFAAYPVSSHSPWLETRWQLGFYWIWECCEWWCGPPVTCLFNNPASKSLLLSVKAVAICERSPRPIAPWYQNGKVVLQNYNSAYLKFEITLFTNCSLTANLDIFLGIYCFWWLPAILYYFGLFSFCWNHNFFIFRGHGY